MVWTPEKIELLKQQWDAGMSITQIGKNLGMTRNAVVGKAHRMGLQRRESPIVRGATAAASTPRVRRPEAPSAPRAAPAAAAPVRPFNPNGPRCKFPIGDPKSTGFRFCTDAALDGYPYCPDHCAVAYSGWAAENAKAANAA
jgi:GcrA cell cycle regulator